MSKQGELFCKALNVPQKLARQKRVQMALLLMISSHRVTWRRNLIPICQQIMAPFIDDIWPLFFRTFNETSHRQRVLFFSEPLVQYLWSKFRVDQA